MAEVQVTGDPATLFAITAGNSDGIFAIDNDGEITIADKTNLDYESTTTSYTLTIIASDATSADVETVTITVNDVNDNRPEFDTPLLIPI